MTNLFDKLTARLIDRLTDARSNLDKRRQRLAQQDVGYAVRTYADDIMKDSAILGMLERIAAYHSFLCHQVEIEDEMNWQAAGEQLRLWITSDSMSTIFRGVTSSSTMYMMEEAANVAAAKAVLGYFVNYAEGLFGTEELKDIFAGQQRRAEAREAERSKRASKILYGKFGSRYRFTVLNHRDEVLFGTTASTVTTITSKPLAKQEAERLAKQIRDDRGNDSTGCNDSIIVCEEK